MDTSSAALQQVALHDMGRVAYAETWQLQQELLAKLIAHKRGQRSLPLQVAPIHQMLLCEHLPVYTLGKSGKEEHLLRSASELQSLDIEYFKINRGGDITFHGPGQCVCYPIFDLDWFFTDIHRYIRMLEEAVIQTLAHYGLKGERLQDFTGVWIRHQDRWRKLCAIGVHLSRWVTMHGLALNVNTDLTYFDHIVPCGIGDQEKSVTSMARELGRELPLSEVGHTLVSKLATLFPFEILEATR